ncbi:MAG: tetratricopeptide repeat protein [Gammaproteobacteria bacterium]|nr:tetratricopeptide repeat protein [Gammaproteobacteria bacterium]
MKLLRDYRIVVPALVLVAGATIIALNQFGANNSKAALATPLAPKIIALADIDASGSKQELPSAHPPGMDSSNPVQQIQFLRTLLNENPDDEMALMGLGNASLMIRRFDDAAPLYERLLQLNPQHLDARSNLASIKLEQGDVDEARNLLEENLKLSPDDGATLFNLGVVYIELKDHSQAVKTWEQWLATNPDSALALTIKRRVNELKADLTPG